MILTTSDIYGTMAEEAALGVPEAVEPIVVEYDVVTGEL